VGGFVLALAGLGIDGVLGGPGIDGLLGGLGVSGEDVAPGVLRGDPPAHPRPPRRPSLRRRQRRPGA
jgi:hypothetical protein